MPRPAPSATHGFPPVPPELEKRNPLGWLKFYGPGAIIASVTIGSGETVFASRGGALFGYTLLWCLLLGALLKGIQVYSGLRYMTLSGHHPLAAWARLPGPRAWFPILLIVVTVGSVPAIFAALPKFIATLLASPLGLDPRSSDYRLVANLYASGFLLLCVLAALGSSYRVMEVSQTVAVLIFLVFVLASVVALRPDLRAILGHLLVPGMPVYPSWVVEQYPNVTRRPPWLEVITYVGAIGGGSYDYLGYLSFLREKRWGMAGQRDAGQTPAEPTTPTEMEVKRGRLWLRAPLTDMWLSFLSVAAFTAIFLILGAIMLHPAHLVPADSEILTVQSRFLTGLSPSLLPLYWIGTIVVFFGTLYGCIEVHTRTLYECGSAIAPKFALIPLKKVRLGLAAFVVTTSLPLIWSGWDPIALATPAAVVGGVFCCGLWCFAMVWTDARFLPGAFRMSLPLRLLTFMAGLTLTAFGLRAIYDYLGR